MICLGMGLYHTVAVTAAVKFNQIETAVGTMVKGSFFSSAHESMDKSTLRQLLIRNEKFSGILTAVLENCVQLVLVVIFVQCNVGSISLTGTVSLTAGVSSTLYLLYKSCLANTPTDVSSDRECLETLFAQCGGDLWTRSRNWCTNAELGEWEGITTDPAGRVTRIDLISCGLIGNFNFDFYQLCLGHHSVKCQV